MSNKLNKLLSVFILICVVCFSGCSSGKQQNDTSKTINQTTDHSPKTYNTFKFSEDRAWLVYNDGKDYYSCIDNSGKMLFRISADEWTGSVGFENGYGALVNNLNKTYIVVDKNGKVYGTYYDATAYGYGYTVVETNVADFDNTYYKYNMYNPNGEVVYTYKSLSNEKAIVVYCGEGVFRILDNNEKTVYFAKTGKEWKCNGADFDYLEFNNGIAVIKTDDRTMAVITSDGEITEFDESNITAKGGRVNKKVYDNSLVYADLDDTVRNDSSIETYNLKEKTVSKMDSNYSQKLIVYSNYGMYPSPSYNNDGILFSFMGTDGLKYCGLFDYELKCKLEPVVANDYIANGNGTFVIQTKTGNTLYDKDGNKLYAFSDKGYDLVVCSSDKYVLVNIKEGQTTLDKDTITVDTKKYNFAVLDEKGEVVFDSIDTSSVKTVDIYNTDTVQ